MVIIGLALKPAQQFFGTIGPEGNGLPFRVELPVIPCRGSEPLVMGREESVRDDVMSGQGHMREPAAQVEI